MNDTLILDIPSSFEALEAKGKEVGFTMPSDLYIGSLLKTLVATKPAGKILELGTGIGLSLSWMIEGMDSQSELITIDNDPALVAIAESFFGNNSRVSIIEADGGNWIENYQGSPFDLVFADAWPGKFSHLSETLNHLKAGGLYVIDDMSPREDWPEGHAEKVSRLIQDLESREDLQITKMNWSTGVIVGTKL